MPYGSFQPSVATPADGTPGLIAYPDCPTELLDRLVETAAIGMGVAVSRGTDKATQIVLGGSDFLGISVRKGALTGDDSTTNLVATAVGESQTVIRTGYIWATVTGSGTAGSKLVNYNTTTGALDLGAAGGGELNLDGVELMNTVSSGGLALLRLMDVREQNTVQSIALNGGAAVTGVVDLAVVESIEVTGDDTLVGDIVLAVAGTSHTIANTDQVITWTIP